MAILLSKEDQSLLQTSKGLSGLQMALRQNRGLRLGSVGLTQDFFSLDKEICKIGL